MTAPGDLGDLFASRVSVIVPDVIDAAHAADLRARIARLGYRRYALVDRGHYDHVEALAAATGPELAALLATLAAAATTATGRPLAIARARALRLVPGDYLLAHHDQAFRDVADGIVEVIADLSAAPVAGAEVHYRRDGQVHFIVPSAPGSASIVERGATTLANHTYVSRVRPAATEVVRVVVGLRPRAA